MSGKFTRTQEKQYTGWITYPKVGTAVPGTGQATSKDRPFVLAAPDGLRVVSTQDLATGYLFKSDKGTEPITGQSVKARMVGGVLPWTQVVRNTANVPSVMARHAKSKSGLGVFEMYPEQFGPQYMTKVKGEVFVRMFTLHGNLAGIATPEQAAGITPKPAKELAIPATKTQPTAPAEAEAKTLAGVKGVLEAQLKTVRDFLAKVKGAKATLSDIYEDKGGVSIGFICGDLKFTFPVTTDKMGTLVTPVAVQETDLTKAVFNVLPKGESFGVSASGKASAPLNALAKPLVKAIQDRALEMRKGAGKTAGADMAQLEATVKAACDIVTSKVAPATYVKVGDGYEVTITDGSMGTVTCVAKAGNPYHCSFVVKDANDASAAAKAVNGGLIPADDNIATLKALASAIATGFARIKRQGLIPVKTPVADKPKYEYRLIGKGKDPNTGEQLYVLERIGTKARTTMNRPQLLKLLEEKRVENAYVRWYKNDRQIRLRGGGSLATMDVAGIRRSSLNRLEGAQDETVTVYSEVIKNLTRDGYTVTEELEVSEDMPVYGKFAVNTPVGHVLTAMFSPSEWQYGVTDGNKVNLKGAIPEDKRRRSMLASSLVSLIRNAAKSAVASTPNNDAPIIPAQDDDFSNPEELAGGYDEAIDVPEAEGSIGTDAPVETAEPVATEATGEDTGLDAADAFAGLEEAEATPDPRIAELERVVNNIVTASAVINTRVTNTLAQEGLTSADCIAAGNDVMDFKRALEFSISEFNAIVASGPHLPEFDKMIEQASDCNLLVITALDKLGAKLRELQKKEAEAEAEAKRRAEEEAKRLAEEEAQRKAQEEADRLATEAEAEAQRLAAEAESQRLAEEEEDEEEEDPFAGLGDDIDTIFRNLPGEIISEGKN